MTPRAKAPQCSHLVFGLSRKCWAHFKRSISELRGQEQHYQRDTVFKLLALTLFPRRPFRRFCTSQCAHRSMPGDSSTPCHCTALMWLKGLLQGHGGKRGRARTGDTDFFGLLLCLFFLSLQEVQEFNQRGWCGVMCIQMCSIEGVLDYKGGAIKITSLSHSALYELKSQEGRKTFRRVTFAF